MKKTFTIETVTKEDFPILLQVWEASIRTAHEHYGFNLYDRSEKDGTGKPYPILHMQL